MKKIMMIFLLSSLALSGWGYPMGDLNPSNFNPLNLEVRMTIPNETTTVGEAVMYVLGPTGYKLIVGGNASETGADIALQPVPPNAFDGQVMSAGNALLLLIGQKDRLLVDPVHRLVSFDRLPAQNKKRSIASWSK